MKMRERERENSSTKTFCFNFWNQFTIIGGGFLEGHRVYGPPPQGLKGRVYPGWHRRNPAEPGRQQHQCRHDCQLASRGTHQVQSGRMDQKSGPLWENSGTCQLDMWHAICDKCVMHDWKTMIYIVLVNKNISSLDHFCPFNFVHWSLVNILPQM